MASIQAWTRRRLPTLLLVLIAGGFAVILGELILYKHYDGIQLVGFIATVAALVIALWGIFAKGGLRITFALLMVLLSIAGVIGVIEHTESRNEDAARIPGAAMAAPADSDSAAAAVGEASAGAPVPPQGGPRPGGGFPTPPPPLAPLGLSGLALMGAVVLFAKKDEALTASADTAA